MYVLYIVLCARSIEDACVYSETEKWNGKSFGKSYCSNACYAQRIVFLPRMPKHTRTIHKA